MLYFYAINHIFARNKQTNKQTNKQIKNINSSTFAILKFLINKLQTINLQENEKNCIICSFAIIDTTNNGKRTALWLSQKPKNKI